MKNKYVVCKKTSHIGDVILAKSPVRLEESDSWMFRLHTLVKSIPHVIALPLDQVKMRVQDNLVTFTEIDADSVELLNAASSKLLTAVFDNRVRIFPKENTPKSVDKLRTFFKHPLKVHNQIGKYQLSVPASQDTVLPFDVDTYDAVIALHSVVFTKGGFHIQWRIITIKPSQSVNISFDFDDASSLPDEDDIADLHAGLTRSIAHMRQRIHAIADSLVVSPENPSVQSIVMFTQLLADARTQLELVAASRD